MNATDTNPFWEWSLSTYAAPGVAQACLHLQDSAAEDVNLLLLAAWLASRGERLDAALLAALEQQCRRWREQVVMPLRRARTAVRLLAPSADLRAQLRDTEREAERWQQDLIWSYLQAQPPAPAHGDPWLENFATLAGDRLTQPGWQALLAALPRG